MRLLSSENRTDGWKVEVVARRDVRWHKAILEKDLREYKIVHVALVARNKYDRSLSCRFTYLFQPVFINHDAVVDTVPDCFDDDVDKTKPAHTNV